MKSLLFAVLLALPLSTPMSADVRPLSDAEHAAVRIAAAYLSGGPAAIAPELSSTSPLRGLPPEELEVRLGPRDGAKWELQTVVPALKDRVAAFGVTYPSGFDDTLIFDLVFENGAYRLDAIRFLAQPSEKQPLFPPAAQIEAAAATTNRKPLAVAVVLLAAAMAAASAFLARQRLLARMLIAGAVVLVALASTFGVLQEIRTRAAAASAVAKPAVAEERIPRLAPLLPLRRALASGVGDVAAAHRTVDRANGRGEIADLWKIQSELQQATRIDDVKAALAKFPSPSPVPLAQILRGRLALLENDEAASALAFEHAVNLGPGRDAVWYETAEALSALGYDARAKAYLERLARIGSREADVYYSLAVIAASEDREDDAEKLLAQAWSMRPVEREQLLGAPVFWSIVRRASVASAIRLSAPVDPLVASPAASTRPVALPPDAQARTSGDLLHVRLGAQELSVPGGAALAPPGTPVIAATEWTRAEQAQRLADLPQVLGIARNAAAYAQPALRQRITATATALATRNRWPELVQLTDNLSASAEHVPPSIFFLRSVGLERMQRHDDAKRLLAEVAASKVLQRRRDAAALTQLAELFAQHDLWDAAVRMYDRSQSIRPHPFIDDRVRQIQMNKRLATKYSTHKTAHFEIRYPEDVSPAMASELGTVLESELARLSEWIPVANFRPVVVNVVWWQEFRATYTGSDFIAGFYNGKITVPFAGVTELVPQVVAILGHELAHAMIAQATNDQAPRWFQEGLAQRIEERPYHENAFNMYDDDRLLPLSLLDTVLRSSPDPEMVMAGYIIAQTDIRFIEARYGRGALKKMIGAYREGLTTEEALARISGKSIGQLETELRAWGRAEQRVFAQ